MLQQYDAPLTVYNRPNNLFVADFVGNPSINFVEAKGAQRGDGALELAVFGGQKAVFKPNRPLDLSGWFQARDDRDLALAMEHKRKAAEKGFVEKGNKDETFRYHIAKVEEEDLSLQERVGDFLLTGVVFGSTLFTIGTQVHVDISGENIMLFDRKSGKCVAFGSLEF